MKRTLHSYRLLVPLFSLALLAACSDEYLMTDPTPTAGSTDRQNTINFRMRSTSGNDSWGEDADRIEASASTDGTGVCAITRGAVITSADKMHETFGIFATLYEANATSPKGVYINNERVSLFTKQADNGSTSNYWGFNGDQTYYWPGSQYKLSFYTYAPMHGEGISASLDLTKSASPAIHYSCPLTVTRQQDLLVAANQAVEGDYEQVVGLTFNHALAVVQILEGDIKPTGYIKSVALRKIHSSGDFSYATNTWATNDSTLSYTITWNGLGKKVSNTSGAVLTPADSCFIVIPQTLPDEAVLRVVFYDPATKKQRTIDGSLAGIELKQGHTTRIRVSIDEDLNVGFDDESTPLDAHYVIADVKMPTEGGDSWTLTASANDGADVSVMLTSELNDYAKQGYWTDKIYTGTYGKNGVSARGTTSVSGTGAGDFAFSVFVPENTSNEKRTITLTLTKSDGTIIGTKTLSQLAPAWDANGIGWEQYQDTKMSSYGFAWDRKVYYVYSYSTGTTVFTQNMRTRYQNYLQSIIDDNNAYSFASVDYFTFQYYRYRYYIKIDYSLMNNLNDFGLTDNDGLTNTKVLYNKGGEVLTNGFESIVMNTLKTESGAETEKAFRLATKDQTGTNSYASYSDLWPSGTSPKGPLSYAEFQSGMTVSDNTEGSAAVGEVLKRNRYYLVKTTTTIENVTSTSTSLKIQDSDLVWYLPAKDEFTYAPSNVEDPIDKSDTWSSTPHDDATRSYLGNGVLTDRVDYHLVRAVRKAR